PPCAPAHRAGPALKSMWRRNPFWRVLALALCALAVAQVAGGPAITGRVTDERGNAVAGATVVLVSASSQAPRISLTGGAGEFTFHHVQPGIDYEIRASSSGLTSAVRTLRLSNPTERAGINLKLRAAIRFEDSAAQ